MKVLFYITFIFLLIGCESITQPQGEVYDIREIGTLSTTEYTVTKVVKLDDQHGLWEIWEKWDDIRSWTKFGDRKILISCRAKIKAGVDLKKIRKEDIHVNGNSIAIVLPAAEVTEFTMEPKHIKTEVESVSWFRDHFTQKEKNDFLKQGEKAIRRDLENSGIYSNAEYEAEVFITDFYKRQGFEKVIVSFEKRNE
jgi:hypothetical protein